MYANTQCGSKKQDNIALKKRNGHSWLRYLCVRVFAPYEKLKAYYPILEKRRWLMPLMQVRRWYRLFRPNALARAKGELITSTHVDAQKADCSGKLLGALGLDPSAW